MSMTISPLARYLHWRSRYREPPPPLNCSHSSDFQILPGYLKTRDIPTHFSQHLCPAPPRAVGALPTSSTPLSRESANTKWTAWSNYWRNSRGKNQMERFHMASSQIPSAFIFSVVLDNCCSLYLQEILTANTSVQLLLKSCIIISFTFILLFSTPSKHYYFYV